MRLAGNSFLVTGGASGLGAACVRRFVAHGANVVIADIDEQAGSRLAAELGSAAHFHRADVMSESEVQAALQSSLRRFQGLRGVIQCAGVLGAARIVGREGAHSLELFSRVVEINLIGTFNVLRLAARAMADLVPEETGERGVVINTASVAAFEAQVGQVAYAAAKGGVAAMTLPAARELASFAIRVVSIAPGVFQTPMVAAMPDSVQQSLAAQTVYPPRLGQPEEFAALAQHIVENPMLNGSVVRLDGAVRLARK